MSNEDTESNETEPTLKFRGGVYTGAVPMIFFIIWAVTFSLMGISSEALMLVGMIIGLMIGLLLSKSRWKDYAETLFTGMSQKIAFVAIAAYFWAGMFSTVLTDGGFVDGLIWVGLEIGVEGAVFTALTFILAALFGTATGTAYGTITAFLFIMLPAGVALGSEPVVLIGAIISGGIFGDNLAPISDTTIISATTQKADIPGVVRTRFKYAIAAAVPATILFLIFGGNGGSTQNAGNLAEIESAANPEGLIFLIPFAAVLIIAFLGHHILTSLTWGIVIAIIITLIKGTPPQSILSVDVSTGEIDGALINGISGYFELSMLLLFILGGTYILESSGVMNKLIALGEKFAKGVVKRAELAMYFTTVLFSILITHNAAAGITVSSFVRRVGEKYNIHGYRRANVLDGIISSVAGIIPWGGHVLLAMTTVATLSDSYDFISPVNPTEMVPYIFHGWALPIVMFMAVITGWGLKFTGPDGKPTKQNRS